VIGNGDTGGPVFTKLLEQWSKEVGVDIRAQVLGLSEASVAH